MARFVLCATLHFAALMCCSAYHYMGCFTDVSNPAWGVRALASGPHAYYHTAESCSTACSNWQGVEYAYFALQNGQTGSKASWCSCSNSYADATQYGTSTNCPANQKGGGNANDVFYRGLPVYLARHESVNYDTAIARCASFGGQLATFSSSDEFDSLLAVRNGLGDGSIRAWIGFDDRNAEGVWRFVDGDESYWFAFANCANHIYTFMY